MKSLQQVDIFMVSSLLAKAEEITRFHSILRRCAGYVLAPVASGMANASI